MARQGVDKPAIEPAVDSNVRRASLRETPSLSTLLALVLTRGTRALPVIEIKVDGLDCLSADENSKGMEERIIAKFSPLEML